MSDNQFKALRKKLGSPTSKYPKKCIDPLATNIP